MRHVWIALAMAALIAGPAVAFDQTDAVATVHQFIDGFNQGGIKTALAACADETSIIDDFPSNEWHGSGACARWAGDFDADATKNGVTDGIVTLGKPKHVDITGDRAYVVLPARFSFKLKGKPMKHPAVFTVVLRKGGTGWRVTGWAWANR